MAQEPSNSTPDVPGDARDFASGLDPADAPDAAPTPPSPSAETSNTPRLPSLRNVSDTQPANPMTASSTPLGMLSNARRPGAPANPRGAPPPSARGGMAASMEEKMRAFHLSRPQRPAAMGGSLSSGPQPMPQSPGGPGLPGGLRLPGGMSPNNRPGAHGFVSAPAVPKAPTGLAARRLKMGGGMKLPGTLPDAPAPGAPSPGLNGSTPQPAGEVSAFEKYAKFVDTKTGSLNLGKAVIHGGGIEFASGSNFSISLDEVDTLDELGKGNYGTVYKVRHARPRMRRPGLGLAGNKAPLATASTTEVNKDPNLSGVVMAMKEIRLELDEAKFAQIIMELDILHRCISPYIIDFYGAFFQEGAVYICIEFMDGGSIDKIYGDGVPEGVLRKITHATTQGLKTLKDDHNIIHRDVKPTNILVNTKGQIKICDFGVSGNLVASIAKTNIGCQSYMAPERISGGGMSQAGAPGGTYSVQSDIWSLGLSIIECAMGRYPYPPETYNNIFSQLSAIVDGEPPDLPAEGYSDQARDFVHRCLNKVPKQRPAYADLLKHPWLLPLSKPEVIAEEDEDEGATASEVKLEPSGTEDKEVADWVINAIERKKNGLMGEAQKPALHAAPLDSVSPAASPG